MKRLSSIIQSFVLSALVVALGVGVAFVNCCHAKTAEIAYAVELSENAQGYSCCDDAPCQRHCCDDVQTSKHGSCTTEHGCNSQTTSSCMSVKVLKLAPFSQAEHFSFHFQDIPHLLPQTAWNAITLPLPVMEEVVCRYLCAGQASPPRVYLHLLRVLRL